MPVRALARVHTAAIHANCRLLAERVGGGTVFLEPLRKWEDRLKKAFASTAKDMMSENPTTVEPSTTIDEAAGIIHDTGHNRLPVVEHGRLVGVVTRVDVLGGLVSD